MRLITLTAKRVGTSVEVRNHVGVLKGIFPNTGYRPTKATKILTLNGWKWYLKWTES